MEPSFNIRGGRGSPAEDPLALSIGPQPGHRSRRDRVVIAWISIGAHVAFLASLVTCCCPVSGLVTPLTGRGFPPSNPVSSQSALQCSITVLPVPSQNLRSRRESDWSRQFQPSDAITSRRKLLKSVRMTKQVLITPKHWTSRGSCCSDHGQHRVVAGISDTVTCFTLKRAQLRADNASIE